MMATSKAVNALIGAYRTLKLQIDDFTESTSQGLKFKLSECFGMDMASPSQKMKSSWTDVTIDQAASTPLSDVLSFVMNNFAVEDVRIVEISMENVVRKVYDGALA